MLPWQALGRMIFKKILSNDETKKKVMAELKKAAKDSDNKIDDNVVEVLDAVWDVFAAVLVTKM